MTVNRRAFIAACAGLTLTTLSLAPARRRVVPLTPPRETFAASMERWIAAGALHEGTVSFSRPPLTAPQIDAAQTWWEQHPDQAANLATMLAQQRVMREARREWVVTIENGVEVFRGTISLELDEGHWRLSDA